MDNKIRSIYFEKFKSEQVSCYCRNHELLEYVSNNLDDYYSVLNYAEKRGYSVALCIERNEEILHIVSDGEFYMNKTANIEYATGKYKRFVNDIMSVDDFYEIFLNDIINMKKGKYDIVLADYRITIYD